MNTNSASAFDQQPLNLSPSNSSPLSVAPQLAFVSRSSSLLFVDSSVSDYKALVAGSAPGTEVHVLNSNEDAVTQITNTLLGRSGISSLHIVSHGEAGGLDFGSGVLNLTDLPAYANQLQSWSNALTADADILLYGCDVAQEQSGKAFVNTLSQLTGADVAASTNLTGKDGDWNLEVATGKIESSLVFNSSVTAAYAYDLNILGETFTGNDVTNPSWIYNQTGTQPSLTARSTAAASTGGIPGGGSDAVGSGALRLTSAATNQASFVIYNRPINAVSGLSIQFNIEAYGGNGADGISFFLIDGNASPTVAGASGGALGYAYAQGGSVSQGLAGGYLGIGLDEFGNFSSVGYGSGGSVNGQTPDSIAVRGSAANSYKYLTGTGTFSPLGIDTPGNSRSAAQKAVQIDLTPAGLLSVKIDLNNDGDFLDTNETPTALQNYDVTANNGALPSTFKFGFSSSTGSSTNIHEITGLNVDTSGGVPYTPLVNFTSSSGSVSEGAASLNLTAQIDVATTNTVTVPVTLSGTAASGTDYTVSNSSITILPGQLTGSITLNPIDNLVVGSNKTAVVTMGTPTGAQLSPQNNVFTATIVDNDYSIAASGSSTYTENGSPVLISPTAAITGDLTASAIKSATVSIGSGFSSAEDRLGIQGQSGTSGTISSTSITWSYNTTSGILTLSGTDTGANYQAALQQVVYSDLSDAPNTTTRAVAYTLNYNSSQQATSSSSPSIAITPVNDAPTVAAPATIAVGGRIATALTGITFADVDAGGSSVTATLTVGAGTLAATSGSGVTVSGTATNLTLSGTISAINSFIAGNSLTYTSVPNSTTTQTLGVSLSDGGNTGSGGTLNSGITNVSLTVTSVPFVKNDFNGDGKSDILWRNPTTNQVAIWEMNGTTLLPGTGFISAIPDSSWQIAGTGDFNADKKADILWRNSSTGQLAIWEMDGTTLLAGTGFVSANPGASWQISGTGDFTGDAKADILWRNSSTGQLAIWEMDGTTLLAGTGFISANPGASWQISGTGDFNGDGKADILWNNSSTNQVAIWEMNGTTLLPGTGFISATASSSWKIARTVNGTDDANGDGFSDIFWYNTATNQTAVWEMNGTTLLPGTGFISAVPDSSWVIEDSGDYNGDAKTDLLWRNKTNNQVAVWELDGTALQPGTGFVSPIASLDWQVAA